MAKQHTLADRILAGETLLAELRALSAGPARRGEDSDKPEVVQVREYMIKFMAWDNGNLSGLRILFGQHPGCLENYSTIEQVDRQLAITDFGSMKGRLISSLASRVDALKALAEVDDEQLQFAQPTGERIFIGHGGSPAWRELKDYLELTLDLKHEEFEREAAGGISITDRLNSMLDACSFAVIVMTGEDNHDDGSSHARENVIHEIGLFQGALGMSRVLLLLEEDCSEFSNIKGLVHVRFSPGRIRATFEDVRKALVREGIFVHAPWAA